jgi:hypothetical protein
MQAVGVAGPDRQDPPIKPFGIVQMSRPVVLKGIGEPILNRL